MDLNADLGEGFGVVAARRRRGTARHHHLGQRGLRLPRRRPGTMRRVCVARRPRATSRSARRSVTATWPVSAGGASTTTPASCVTMCCIRSPRWMGSRASAGTRVSYVKPHGALYNTAADDDAAGGRGRAAPSRSTTWGSPVLGLPASALLRAADAAGLRVVTEGFADRGVPRLGVGWCRVPRRVRSCTIRSAVAGRARLWPRGEISAVDGTVARFNVSSRSACTATRLVRWR